MAVNDSEIRDIERKVVLTKEIALLSSIVDDSYELSNTLARNDAAPLSLKIQQYKNELASAGVDLKYEVTLQKATAKPNALRRVGISPETAAVAVNRPNQLDCQTVQELLLDGLNLQTLFEDSPKSFGLKEETPLRYFPNLHRLSLCNNKLSVSDARCMLSIEAAFRALPKLRELEVEYNALTAVEPLLRLVEGSYRKDPFPPESSNNKTILRQSRDAPRKFASFPPSQSPVADSPSSREKTPTPLQLESLTLAHNAFTSLCIKTPLRLCFLQVLDISHNHLAKLNVRGARFSILRELNLSFNCLEELHSDDAAPTPGRDSGCAAAFAAAFPRLSELDVSHNCLRTLRGIDSCFYLSELRANNNRLRHDPTVARTNPLASVGCWAGQGKEGCRKASGGGGCGGTGRDGLKGGLQVLDLGNNEIQTLQFFPKNSTGLSGVWYLNLSCNNFGINQQGGNSRSDDPRFAEDTPRRSASGSSQNKPGSFLRRLSSIFPQIEVLNIDANKELFDSVYTADLESLPKTITELSISGCFVNTPSGDDNKAFLLRLPNLELLNGKEVDTDPHQNGSASPVDSDETDDLNLPQVPVDRNVARDMVVDFVTSRAKCFTLADSIAENSKWAAEVAGRVSENKNCDDLIQNPPKEPNTEELEKMIRKSFCSENILSEVENIISTRADNLPLALSELANKIVENRTPVSQ